MTNMRIDKGQTVDSGVYDKNVINYGTITGGEFRAKVYNVFTAGTINGGEFYGELTNSSAIFNAVLKDGSELLNTFRGKIRNLTIDGNVKLDGAALNAASSIEMKPNSTLELDSMPDFRKIQNMQNIKVNGKELIFKNGVLENHDNIDNGYFNMPVINQKDGVINGGSFENLENHGTINNAALNFNKLRVESFKNYGTINGGELFAENNYNFGVITGGRFVGTMHNENGSITGGRFYNIELLSGQIQNARISKELIIKGGSVENITLFGSSLGLRVGGFPKIKNEAGVTIEKLDIWGKVKLSASELSHVKSVELLQVDKHGGTILYLDSVPDFSKIKGSGTIKVGDISYNTDGSIISSQNNAVAFVNNSFKLDLAVKKAAEQKSSYIDEKNAQNNLQNDFKVDLLATPQNSDDNLL